MKIKTFMACLLALLLTVPGADMYAQTRKRTGSTKKTTATVRKNSAASTGSLTKAKLVDHTYIGLLCLPDFEKRLGKDVGTVSWLTLNSDDIDLQLVGKDLGGTWSVSGSTLSFISGSLKARLTSTDSRVFKGRLTGSGDVNWGLVFYKIKNGKLTSETLKKSFNKGTFRALLEVDTPRDEELLFPVNIKFVPNEDGTGGTYKFTADNALGVGLIKGTYTFTEGSVTFTSNLENCNTKEVKIRDDVELLVPKIGTKYIDSVGNCTLYLLLLNQ